MSQDARSVEFHRMGKQWPETDASQRIRMESAQHMDSAQKKGNRMVGIDEESGWIEVLPFNDRTTQTVKNICQESLTIIKKQNQSNSKAVKKAVNYKKEHEFVSDYFKA